MLPWTEGHRMLWACPATSPEIAKATGCTELTVRSWRQRDAVKMPRQGTIRQILEARFGIPQRAWLTPLATAQPAPPQPELPEPVLDQTMVQPVARVDLSKTGGVRSALHAQVERLSADLEQARNAEFGADPNRVLKLEAALSSAIEKAARADGKMTSIEEHRMTKTLTYRQHCERILSALAPYPEARQAVLEALRGM